MPSRASASRRARRWRRGGCPRRSARAAAGGPRARSRPRAARICSGRRRVRSSSPRSTVPDVGRSTPPTASTRVDLPAPFGPEQSGHLTRRELERDVLDHGAAAARDGQAFEPQDAARGHRRSQRPPRCRGRRASRARFEAPRRSARTRSACRSRAPRSSHSTRTRGSCRGRRGSPARRRARGCCWMTWLRCSVSSSGRPAAGSSSRTTRGLPTTARATSTRRRSRALERRRPSSSARTSRPTNSIASSTSVARRRRVGLGVLVHQRDVVEDRQLLDRLLGLERPPQPPSRPPEVGHAEQVLAERADAPCGRADEAAQHVEERRLAGAVRADQAARPGREHDGHPVERRDAAEADGEILDLDHAIAPPAPAAAAHGPPRSRPRFLRSFGHLVDDARRARSAAPGGRRRRTGSIRKFGCRPHLPGSRTGRSWRRPRRRSRPRR